MKLTEIFTRGKVKSEKGNTAQFRAALKGRSANSVLVSTRGETQEDADAALIERIRDRFRGSYEPLCLQFRGQLIVIWRNGGEWAYGHLSEGPTLKLKGMVMGYWLSRDEVEREGRRHLAQRMWDEQEETSDILVHPDEQRAFSVWARKEKIMLTLWNHLRDIGWSNEELPQMASHAFDRLEPNRIAELGDPRPLVLKAEDERNAIS